MARGAKVKEVKEYTFNAVRLDEHIIAVVTGYHIESQEEALNFFDDKYSDIEFLSESSRHVIRTDNKAALEYGFIKIER